MTDKFSRTQETPWHHLPDGTFRNPKGSPSRGSATLRQAAPFFVDMFRRSWTKIDIPADHIVERTTATAAMRSTVKQGAEFLTWLGHASFLFRIGDQIVLTDPYLTKYAGPAGLGPKRYVKSGVAIADLPKIDILVVSHNHYDHLDERALAQLPDKHDINVIVPLGLGAFFLQRGFTKVVEIDWHESVTRGSVEVTALPVVHWSRRTGFDMNRSLWAGFAFRAQGHHLFFGGDSGYGPVFKETGAEYGPFDTALLGIGAYAPRAVMRASHATPEEAVQMGADLQARRLVGMHWGTVTLTQEPPFEPPERFLKAGSAAGFTADNLWVMKIGETRPLKGAWPSNI